MSALRLLLTVALLLLIGGCARRPALQNSFIDATREAGIAFVHSQFRTPRYLADVMGPGCGWADFDRDGREDLFFVSGSGPDRTADAEKMPPGRLFRNRGDGTFEDVTARVGLDVRGWGMGCSWADYDNDGFPDLFVTMFGTCRLYRNDGGSRFADVTAKAGIRCSGFYSAAAWGDYDADGLVDLHVGQSSPTDAAWLKRLDSRGWPKNTNFLPVKIDSGEDIALIPGLAIFPYPEGHSTLYRNRGDGTFEDTTESAGLGLQRGRTWQPVFCDFNDDGWPDLFISNDNTPNSLYLNRGDGTFSDVSIGSFIATMQSNMGVAVGDFDNTCSMSLFIPHWYSEGNVLFRNNRPLAGGGLLTFTEVAEASGVREDSLRVVGFGPAFLDFDNDGSLDLLVLNGHTHPCKTSGGRLIAYRPFLYRNDGQGRFTNVAAAAGGFLKDPYVGRCAALSDYNGDGSVDFAVTTNNGPAYLVKNLGRSGNHWLELRLEGKRSNRDAIGARVWVTTGGKVQVRDVLGGEGYLGNNSRVLHFGLGRFGAADSIRIRWPLGGGVEETVNVVKADARYRIEEGKAAGLKVEK